MNESPNIIFLTLDDLTASYAPLLKRSFWLASTFLMLFLVAQTNQTSMELLFESYAIVGILLIPSWLWATQQIHGLPVAPAIAIFNIMYVVFPIINASPALDVYTVAQQSAALAAEAICMVAMVATWYYVSRRPVQASYRPRMLNPASQHSKHYYKISMLIIVVSTLYSISKTNGVYYFYFIQYIGVQWQNTIASFLSLTAVVASFAICLNIGQRNLSFASCALGLMLIAMNMLASMAMLLLSAATFQFFASIIGYLLARGRAPWVTLCIFFFFLNILHLGKAQMRDKYWSATGTGFTELDLANYPSWYGEWLGKGWARFTHSDTSNKESYNLLERVSIIQMMLLAQTRIPDQHKFLMGETYAIIPQLIVPRWITPNKPRSHEGQVILSVSMGLQQRQATERTFIAWGLLAESWANFGWFGPPILGIVLGFSFGKITSWSVNCPFASYRFILCAMFFFIAMISIQVCASVLVTALFQTVAAITVLCLIFMSRYDYTPAAPDPNFARGAIPLDAQRSIVFSKAPVTS